MARPGFRLAPETTSEGINHFPMGTTVLPSIQIGSPNTDFTVAVVGWAAFCGIPLARLRTALV
jgi:hypothetical protein